MNAYLPIAGLVVTVAAALFITAADRRRQLADWCGGIARMQRLTTWRRRFSWRRVTVWMTVLFLLSYIWTYQRVQDAIAVQLTASGIEEVAVGSLVIPWSAFFRSEYAADTGFSRSKKRARTSVTVTGDGWTGLSKINVHWGEAGLAKINKVTGEAFVFSYLTDIKILRPAVEQFMQTLMRSKKIAGYEIETFDNRGPYIIVALSETSDGNDVQAAATAFAGQIFNHLTKVKKLKVNQVVIKVVEREPYLADKTINLLVRGKAGSY